MLFQIVMIIDLFYIWGEKWRESYFSNGEEDGNVNVCWGIIMIITSIVLYGGCGYFMYKNFMWFSGSNCGGHRTYLIISTALIVVATIATLVA